MSIPQDNEQIINEHNNLHLALSLHPDVVFKISDMQKELMIQELAELPPLEDGQVFINRIYAVEQDDSVEVGFYIRNASCKPIRFGKTLCSIVDEQGHTLAQQTFDLRRTGEIPPYSARPWEIFFNKFAKVESLKETNWELRLHNPPVPIEPKDPQNEQTVKLPFEKLIEVEDFIQTLPAIQPDEVKIHGFYAEETIEEEILVTLVVRNGYSNPLTIERLPVTLYDAKERPVASGVFVFKDFVIEPKTAGLRTLSFAAEKILVDDLDLRKWRINISRLSEGKN